MSHAASSPRAGGVIAGALFTLLGIAFLSNLYGLFSFRLGYIWPLLLMAAGLSQISGRTTRMKAERARTRELTTAEERVRIARELHDIVAHGVSLMIVQIAAARRVASTQPEASDEALRAAESAGRQSLEELRSLVAILRSADRSIEKAGGIATPDLDVGMRPLPTLADVEHLVNSTREAGLEVSVAIEGKVLEMTPASELAVYRVIQESLTNALRHGGRCKVEVVLTFYPTAVDVAVVDDGPGAHGGPVPSAGHGLIGMSERVAAVGGRIEFGPVGADRGWRVVARIPVKSR